VSAGGASLFPVTQPYSTETLWLTTGASRLCHATHYIVADSDGGGGCGDVQLCRSPPG